MEIEDQLTNYCTDPGKRGGVLTEIGRNRDGENTYILHIAWEKKLKDDVNRFVAQGQKQRKIMFERLAS